MVDDAWDGRKNYYMLTTHVDFFLEDRKMTQRKRSARIIMTTEARVLKQMRNKKGLSMRQAGELLGKSHTYIAHIENGRTDVPSGYRLEALLEIYGGIKAKSFHERVKNFQEIPTPKSELIELVNKIGEEKINIILGFVKSLVSS